MLRLLLCRRPVQPGVAVDAADARTAKAEKTSGARVTREAIAVGRQEIGADAMIRADAAIPDGQTIAGTVGAIIAAGSVNSVLAPHDLV